MTIQETEKNCTFSAVIDRTAPTSVGILNGFGRTLGDSIIGLQALSIALRMEALPARAVLFRLPDLPPMLQALYAVAEFAQLATLPWEFSTTVHHFDTGNSVDRVVDLRDFAFDPAFLRTSMIDFFLERLGVPSHSIATSCKRNTWLASRVAAAAQPFARGYILVCPNSSNRLRDMPSAVHAHILKQGLSVAPVVTQGHVSREFIGHVDHAAPCASLEDLCGLVRHARLVISTDTAMVHLADAFDVPCVAFFPTHRPEWRVRDYPKCRAVMLQSKLPLGIEFARDARDEELARAAWFPDGDDFDWLADLLTPMLDDLSASPSVA